MPTLPTPTTKSAPAIEDEFLAIVCSDEDLVRAEFYAIIAVEWQSLPPDSPEDENAIERLPGATQHQPSGGQALPGGLRHPGIHEWAPERSPPPVTAGTADRKEGVATIDFLANLG
ncbi:MAG: hypothetical protein ACR2N4_04360 [Jatrophihabitans sp.]